MLDDRIVGEGRAVVLIDPNPRASMHVLCFSKQCLTTLLYMLLPPKINAVSTKIADGDCTYKHAVSYFSKLLYTKLSH